MNDSAGRQQGRVEPVSYANKKRERKCNYISFWCCSDLPSWDGMRNKKTPTDKPPQSMQFTLGRDSSPERLGNESAPVWRLQDSSVRTESSRGLFLSWPVGCKMSQCSRSWGNFNVLIPEDPNQDFEYWGGEPPDFIYALIWCVLRGGEERERKGKGTCKLN